jgi:hypothetical protein
MCCMAFIIDVIVAIITGQLATITMALSFIERLDDFLYLSLLGPDALLTGDDSPMNGVLGAILCDGTDDGSG